MFLEGYVSDYNLFRDLGYKDTQAFLCSLYIL